MDQSDLMNFLLDVLETQQLPYAIGGSHAGMAFGVARFTHDIDVVVGLTPGSLAAFCAAFPESEYYVSDAGARAAAAKGGTFNIIHPDSGLKIDVFVPETEFERLQLARAVRVPTSASRQASFVTPEDLIIKKMEYYREGGSDKHLRDITGVLKAMGDRIDQAYVSEWADRLGLTEIWSALLQRVAGP